MYRRRTNSRERLSAKNERHQGSAKLEYHDTAAASFELSHVNEIRAGVNCRFGGF
jgi:hypothetical protein